MKKNLFAASAALAMALVIVMMLPVFANTITTPATTLDTVDTETTTVEDGEHRHSWEIEYYPTVAHLYCACGNFVVLPNDELLCKHDFVTEFDGSCHWDRCIDCDYRAGGRHELEEEFYGEAHYTECACGYTAGMHYGVEYHSVDDNCYAYCRSCGHETISSHNWDGFVCRDCGRELSGPTGAIVKTISQRDGYYRVKIEVNGERHYLNLDKVPFKKGDFVVINHNGNEIESIDVVVDHDIIDAPDNLDEYASEIIADMFWNDEDVKLVDIVLKSHEFCDDGIDIEYEKLSVSFNSTAEYEIYDLRTGRVTDTLCNGDAVLYYFTGSKVYFIIVW